MTGRDFIRAGVVFERHVDGVVVLGPRDDDGGLLKRLRVEVESRRTHSAECPKGKVNAQRCDLCGDDIAPMFSGWCELCVLARAKDLEAYEREAG